MSHIMKLLGVKTDEEWLEKALSRPVPLKETEILARKNALEQVAAIFTLAGNPPSPSLKQDQTLLVTGQMSAQEHHAYLMKKYSS